MTDNKPLYDPEDIRFIREEVAPKMGDMEVEHILYLAGIIREVDGSNSLGACKLAEAILSHHLIKEIKFKEK